MFSSWHIKKNSHTQSNCAAQFLWTSFPYKFPILHAFPLDRDSMSSSGGRFWHLMPVLACLYWTFFGMGVSLFCAPLLNIGPTSSPILPLIEDRFNHIFQGHIPAGVFDLASGKPSPRDWIPPGQWIKISQCYWICTLWQMSSKLNI